MGRLFGFGQVIESDIDVPGALAAGGRTHAAASLIIRRIEASADEAIGPAGFSRDGEGLRLEIPGLASYRCQARAIAVVPRAAASDDFASALGDYLIASALPAALWMQGRLVLHAAAVCAPAGGPALAILGRSRAGKSTLAAQLVARGARLLADDCIAIAFNSGAPVASGLPGGLFLRDDGGVKRRFQPVAVERTIEAAPLGALVVPDCAAGSQSGELAPLDPRQALESILSHRHRPRAPDLLGMRAEVLEACAQLVRSAPVYALRRLNDKQTTVETDRLVRSLWQECLQR